LDATLAVGVARQIQPLPRPLLAVMRGLEQLIDEALVCLGPRVRQKSRGLFGCRWQSDQVQIHAAQQSSLRSFRRRLDTRAIELRENKGVDWIANPFLPPHSRRLLATDRGK